MLSKNTRVIYIDTLLLVFLISISSYGQQNEDLLDYAEDIKILNPKEAIRISESVLRRLEDVEGKNCAIYSTLIEANIYIEAYDKALEYIFNLRESNCKLSNKSLYESLLLEAKIYHILQLNNYEEKVIVEAKNILDKIDNSNDKDLMNWQLEIYNTFYNNKSDNNKILDIPILPKENKNNQDINTSILLDYLILLGRRSNIINTQSDYERNVEDVLVNYTVNYEKLYYENFSLIDAQFYSANGYIDKAIQILENTLNYLEDSEEFQYYKSQILEELITNYIEIKDKKSLLIVRKSREEVESKILEIETSVINKIIENKTEQNNIEIIYSQRIQKQVIFGITIIFILGVSIATVFWFRYHWQQKQYNEIKQYLNKLEEKKSKVENKPIYKTKTPNKISDELENQIIKGLEVFEKEEDFLNNNVSLAYLASKLEVITKYLSGFLNSQLNESFSSYINRLRIEFIVRKLKNDPKYLKYKISYLAEVAGYTSHSSFTTAFKAVTGMAPTKFITFLKK